MQIREMNLKELEIIYELLSQLRTSLTYNEFDDLVYDMRHMDYKMIGLFQRGELITFAGVAVQTSFYHKRHLYVFDLVTDSNYRGQKYGTQMLEYLETYASTAMCENMVLSSSFEGEETQQFLKNKGFHKENFSFLKTLK